MHVQGLHAVRWLTLAGVLSLAGCGLFPSTLQRTAGPAPIAERVIDLDGRCARTEEDGFAENAVLRVKAGTVEALNWDLKIGRRGTCHFDLSQFRQTQRRPHAELAAYDGSACKVMIWADARRITLAHANCQKHCTPGVYETAWPTLFDPASGACSKD